VTWKFMRVPMTQKMTTTIPSEWSTDFINLCETNGNGNVSIFFKTITETIN
jgi:hypothetical protein